MRAKINKNACVCLEKGGILETQSGVAIYLSGGTFRACAPGKSALVVTLNCEPEEERWGKFWGGGT